MTPGWTTATPSAGVEFEDAVHAGHGEGDAAVEGDAAADVADAGSAGGDGDAFGVGEAEDLGDIPGAFREDDDFRGMGGIPLVGGMLGDGVRGAGDLFGAEEFLQGLGHGHGVA